MKRGDGTGASNIPRQECDKRGVKFIAHEVRKEEQEEGEEWQARGLSCIALHCSSFQDAGTTIEGLVALQRVEMIACRASHGLVVFETFSDDGDPRSRAGCCCVVEEVTRTKRRNCANVLGGRRYGERGLEPRKLA